jgi:hypothetical protein
MAVSRTMGRPCISNIPWMDIRPTGTGAMTDGTGAILDAIPGLYRRKFRRLGFSDLILITWTITRCGMAEVTRRTSATYTEHHSARHRL